jgi:transcriptional regulator PpsR
MDGKSQTGMMQGLAALERTLGDLPSDVAARVVAAAGDVALVISPDGVIEDLAIANNELAEGALEGLRTRRWIDTVTADSRQKVADLLADAQSKVGKDTGRTLGRWREVNQTGPEGSSVPLKYVAVGSGTAGRVIAVGRDLSANAALQQRLLQAQQAMEREVARLRQAEQRYRLLFNASREPIIIIDGTSRRIVEVNPAAASLLEQPTAELLGQTLGRITAPESIESVAALFATALMTGRSDPTPISLPDGRVLSVSASVFRHERSAHVLLRLGDPAPPATMVRHSERLLLDAVERVPEAFVLTDKAMVIVAANAAFLDLAQIPGSDLAVGRHLGEFLGRSTVDLSVLAANIREHDSVRNFNTVVRGRFDTAEPVELSGVSVPDGENMHFAMCMRSAARSGPMRAVEGPERRNLPRSAEQMTDLIGRVSLKEIVRETTDIIERLCIEAALDLTGNNRASAAEMLGLSRQSLYSKLNRFGIGNGEDLGDMGEPAD